MTLPDIHPQPHGDTAASEDALLHLDEGDIYVCQDGPRGAPVLLLIHGSATSSRSWDALVPLLTTSHHVIRIDLPGHGRSAEPADGDYSPPEQGRRISTALDRLGVERAIVVGHSSGGYPATALAEQRPDLVTALALINTGPGMVPSSHRGPPRSTRRSGHRPTNRSDSSRAPDSVRATTSHKNSSTNCAA
ncbi:alpha/beta hydrolase fold [Streptomyces venezuelae]|nr:alpha/beta hydrolase fold [Streptomyces venezuelae]